MKLPPISPTELSTPKPTAKNINKKGGANAPPFLAFLLLIKKS